MATEEILVMESERWNKETMHSVGSSSSSRPTNALSKCPQVPISTEIVSNNELRLRTGIHVYCKQIVGPKNIA